MSEKYDLQTDVLATIVAMTPVTEKHTALLEAFGTRTEFGRAHYVMTRGTFGDVAARVLDASGREIAADHRAWIDAQLAAHGGSARAVWQAHRERGYLLTEIMLQLHYFAYDRGGAQDNFVQIEVWEKQEFVVRELFPRDDRSGLPDADELRRAWPGTSPVNRVPRRTLGVPCYRLKAAVDMQRLTTLGDLLHAGQRLSGTEAQASNVYGMRGLTYDDERRPWSGRRFLDDWTGSSAGRTGARLCKHWTFALWDRTSTTGERKLSFMPQWAHSRPVAALKDALALNAGNLYDQLIRFDRRIGMPFAWYFHALHGDLLRREHLSTVLDTTKSGQVALPEHDREVLHRWGADPYGF